MLTARYSFPDDLADRERETCGDAPVDTRAPKLAREIDTALTNLRCALRIIRDDSPGSRWAIPAYTDAARTCLERAGLHELAARCWEDGDLETLWDDAMIAGVR